MRWVAALVLVVGACASRLGSELDSLETQHREQVRRLEIVKHEIAAAEARALEAKRDAAFEECRSAVAAIQAEVDLKRANCIQEIAGWNSCEARQEQKKANSALGGCAFGIAAALISGGAAAPLALGGCAAGVVVGDARAAACGYPACKDTYDELDAIVLAQRNLTQLPMCGGYAGFSVETEDAFYDYGLEVRDVGPGTFASAAGLRVGDVLVAIGGWSLNSEGRLDDDKFFKTLAPGAALSVTFIRGHTEMTTSSRASNVKENGELDASRVWLGIKNGDVVRHVPYATAVRVSTVEKGSPADAAALQVDDVIEAVETARIVSFKHLQDRLRELRSGRPARLVVRRDGTTRVVEVVLGERAERVGL